MLGNTLSNYRMGHPYIMGEKIILSDMSDWNPAEIIGTRPRQLATSLYQEVVTNMAWSVSRKRTQK